ncbi:MAG: DUF1819 family protein [Deltaproteobacteria bacterium]|jgi:hypothetical protein|nr:DUF1819 family protein [Deltaproteobacteria bacterium]
MIEKERQSLSKYNTAITTIGGLKDTSVIYRAIETYLVDKDDLKGLISKRNEFNLRTEESRGRIERAIKTGFLQFINQDHRDLLYSIFTRSSIHLDKELILFWQFSLLNRLHRDISLNVFMKSYLSGRTGISKDDIVAYLREFIANNKQLDLSWSASTINTISTKYLNFMTKLNLLEGARKKTFKHIKITAESLVLFLYFAKLHAPENSNILTNEILPLSFVSTGDIRDRLKKLSIKGYFDMNFNGVELNIELTHSFKGICDVLFNRP